MAQINEEEEVKDDKEGEVMDFNRPDFKFEPKESHDWRQQGPFVICKSCDLEHAVWVGMDKLLMGLNGDGTPIFKDRS